MILAAAEALGRVRPSSLVVPVLMRLLKTTRKPARPGAATAARRGGGRSPTECVGGAIALTKDADKEVRVAAVDAAQGRSA